MKIFVDSADIRAIRYLSNMLPIEGVTTNPTLVAKAPGNPLTSLSELKTYLGDKELHVQVVSLDTEDMIRDAQKLMDTLGRDVFIKVPVIPGGFAAIKKLSEEGISVTATAVYTPFQAMLAANCGAKRVAPYVSRIDRMGCDGIEVVKKIQNILSKNWPETEIIAASIKNAHQVEALSEIGIYAVTLTPDLIHSLAENPLTRRDAENFVADLDRLF